MSKLSATSGTHAPVHPNSNDEPPAAKRVPTEYRIHGEVLHDEYAWLRDKNDPEVIAYLQAENAYADSYMRPHQELRKTLYDEMLSHIKQTDDGVPHRQGDHFYYSRTVEGQQYPVLCRKHQTLDAAEQVILDINELADGKAYMGIGAVEVSDDGNLLAYSTDDTGFRQYTLHIKDLRSGELLVDTAEKTGSIVWASDNRTLFYSVEDEAKRHYRLYRHQLGSPASEDTIVFQEDDERFSVGAFRSRSGRFVFIEIGSHTTTEVRFAEANAATSEFRIVEPRRDNIEYSVEHHADEFYIRVNDTARTFRLVAAPMTEPSSASWREIVPAREDSTLEDIQIFEKFFVMIERELGLPVFRVGRYGEPEFDTISFPEPAYSASPRDNTDWHASTFRYSYQSLVTPASIFDYDIATDESKLLKRIEVPGFSRDLYVTERAWATAHDGVKVPVSVVFRRDAMTDGSNPLYVYGYGAYGIVTPISFNSNRLSLLDRGVVIAIAHVRGSGDLGKTWHDAGKMMRKMNTFLDFIACVEFLTAHGYGDPKRVAIEGGSAGGLLMGAVVNLRPELFRAVVSHVPFVDVINTMLDAALPLTVGEYEEWGNPNERDAFEYMRSYSPYDNLKEGAYPAMLVKTSLNDSQVMYWEPAKYVAKLRTLKRDNAPVLLKTNMEAGHSGASGRYDYLHEIAWDHAFLLTELRV